MFTALLLACATNTATGEVLCKTMSSGTIHKTQQECISDGQRGYMYITDQMPYVKVEAVHCFEWKVDVKPTGPSY